MKISFAICTKNEGEYINQLLSRLAKHIQYDRSGTEFDIIILDDYSTDPATIDILDFFGTESLIKIKLYHHALQNDFASHKNYLIEKCLENSNTPDHFILQLDADEFVEDAFLNALPNVLIENPEVDAYWIPRVNTVDGLEHKHIAQYLWTIDKIEDRRRIKVLDKTSDEYKVLKNLEYIIEEDGDAVTFYEPIICWPDYQMRFFRANTSIYWTKKVHERLVGFTKFSFFPKDPQYAIQHYKTIQRQIKQNTFYSQISK